MNSHEISALSAATSGRADILTAGTLILHEVMSHFRFRSVVVSERGLRFGLVLREWERKEG
jgi:exopolyphosphatase/pppGpp-phosphohydrolase